MSVISLQRPTGMEHLGYGTFGWNLEKGLKSLGVEVHSPPTMETYTQPDPTCKTVVWASQPAHAPGAYKGQYNVAFTMWESDRLPELFACNLHNFDLVAVPSGQNVALFGALHPNVKKVPLGYDSDVWTYVTSNVPQARQDRPFKFLHCAAGAAEESRKGTDLVIKAFRKAFPDWRKMDPQPQLTVKCLRLTPEDNDFTDVITGKMDLMDLRDLYWTHDCMVLPSRGEGWGYHPLQAVATGMPTILSQIPGHTEYSYLPGFLTVPVQPHKAGNFLQGDGGNWWEPDLDFLTLKMKLVYENYAYWLSEAKLGAKAVKKEFDHVAMARKLVSTIGKEKLVEHKPGPWYPFSQRHYPVEVNRNLGHGELDIGGTNYAPLLIGERKFLPANVRYVLGNAGYLANAEETHPGILPEMVN